MSSVGFGLLRSLLLSGGSFSALSEHGIQSNHFVGSERRAFEFINEYMQEYGHLPLLETVSTEIEQPACFSNLPDEPLPYWADRVKVRLKHQRLNSAVLSVQEHLSAGNVSEAVSTLGEHYMLIRESEESRRVVDLLDAEALALERHNEIQSGRRLAGVPFGFPFLDRVSGGAQAGDLIVIVGTTGVGKSMLSLTMGITARLNGHNVLYSSPEMSLLQVGRRGLGLRGSLNTQDLKMGTLSQFGVDRLERLLQEDPGGWFKIVPGGLQAQISDLVTFVKELTPDLLIVDGAYLLRVKGFRSGARWEKMLEILEVLKQVAVSEQIPVILSYQYGKKSEGLEGIAGTWAIPQIASVVLSFEYEYKEDAESSNPVQYRILRLLKGRDGEKGSLKTTFNMLRSTIVQHSIVSGSGQFQDPDEIPEDEEDTAII